MRMPSSSSSTSSSTAPRNLKSKPTSSTSPARTLIKATKQQQQPSSSSIDLGQSKWAKLVNEQGLLPSSSSSSSGGGDAEMKYLQSKLGLKGGSGAQTKLRKELEEDGLGDLDDILNILESGDSKALV